MSKQSHSIKHYVHTLKKNTPHTPLKLLVKLSTPGGTSKQVMSCYSREQQRDWTTCTCPEATLDSESEIETGSRDTLYALQLHTCTDTNATIGTLVNEGACVHGSSLSPPHLVMVSLNTLGTMLPPVPPDFLVDTGLLTAWGEGRAGGGRS